MENIQQEVKRIERGHWFNQQTNFHVHTLRNMLEEVIILKSQFDSVICRHIYRERNQISNILSKEVAQQHFGTYMIQEQLRQDYYQYFHRPFIDEHIQDENSI